jgi:hypothetical protein
LSYRLTEFGCRRKARLRNVFCENKDVFGLTVAATGWQHL